MAPVRPREREAAPMTPSAAPTDATALQPEAWELVVEALDAIGSSANAAAVAVSAAYCGAWTVPGAMKDWALHTAPVAMAPHASTLVLLGIFAIESAQPPRSRSEPEICAYAN